MHYIVEDIEFDFEDSQGTIDKDEQQFITENAIGLWYVDSQCGDPEEELIDKITEKLVGVSNLLNIVRTDHTV